MYLSFLKVLDTISFNWVWRRSVHLPRKGLREDSKEKEERAPHEAQRDETFDSDNRRAPETPLDRPRKGGWITKYAIRARVTLPFFVFLFFWVFFFSVNLKSRNLSWNFFYWDRNLFPRDMWYVMGSKIFIATNWRKSQGVYTSLRETTR